MLDNHVKLGEPVWLTENEEINITETISEIIEEDKLNIPAYNICGDHLHMILVCEEDELPKIVGKIKAVSTRKHNIEKGITVPATNETLPTTVATATRGHVPLSGKDGILSTPELSGTREHVPLSSANSPKKKNKYNQLWTQKFGRKEIVTDEQLNNTLNYIRNNRKKHELPENKKLNAIIDKMTCTIDHALRFEYNGGFDVVIGNPPYVRSRGLMNESEKIYFTTNYETASYQLDLYKLFIEKSLKLINIKGILSLITPSVFLSNDFDKPLRKFILVNYNLSQVSTSEENIFADASVKTVIFVIKRKINQNNVDFFKIIKGGFLLTKSISSKIFINQDYTINENIDLNSLSILMKLQNINKLDELFIVKNGIKVRKELLYHSQIDTNYKPFLLGKNINSYSLNYSGIFIHYLQENEKKFSNQAFRTKEIFECDKLIVRQILGKRIITSYDKEDYYTDQTTYVINKKSNKCNLLFLLSIMNSKMIYYYFKNSFSDSKITFPKVKRSQILQFPIKQISLEAQQPFIGKADLMLSLNKQKQEKINKFRHRLETNFEIDKFSNKIKAFYNYDFKILITELKKKKIKLTLSQQDEWEKYFNNYKEEINKLQKQIDKTNKEIDQMVYELYVLSDDDIKIIEENIL